jgi:DNA invertase Pin-like site-specific DNA recombinase
MLSCLLARSASAAIVLMMVGVVALGAPPPAAIAAPPASPSTTVLAQGAGLGASPSGAVRRVQRILRRRGFSLGPPGADGRFGPLTAAAVRRMQTRYGLAPDGVVGPKTRRVLGLIAATSARRARSRRPSPQSSTTSRPPAPSAPSTAAPAARPPATLPAGRTAAPSAGGKRDSGPATILAALALLVALVALAISLWRIWRADHGLEVAALDRDLYLEGESERPDVGAFRGFAIATAVPSRGEHDPRRTRFLVDDPLKPAPVWVQGGDVRRSPSQLAAGEPVIGYVTAGPDPAIEQQAFMAIESACERSGWELGEIIHDEDTGRLVGRPGLTLALERIAAGKARGLIVSDARRLTRSLTALAALIDWFREAEAVLVLLDLDVDTATVHGHHTASAIVAVAGWEDERTTARSRRRLARVQTPDRTVAPTVEERAALIERIAAMRAAGMSVHAIGIQLDNEGVPPPSGVGRWTTTAVKSALQMAAAADDGVREALPRIPHRRR